MNGFRVLGISWVGIGSDRYDETLHLFRDVLGLQVTDGAERQALLTVAPGQMMEIFGHDGPGKSRNTPPAIGLEVDDFAAACAALKAAEVELEGDPGEWEGHRWQYFRTPDGYLFSIKVSA